MKTKAKPQEQDICFATQAQVAAFFGVHRRTFCDWQERGCPGSSRKYSLRDICQWIVNQRRYGGEL